MNVSEQLRQAIVESGETHYRIWKDSGVSSRIIDRFVDGTADIRVSTIDRLAEYFGLELTKKKSGTAPKEAGKKPGTAPKQAGKKPAAKRQRAKKSAE
jgi:hypothetical protein